MLQRVLGIDPGKKGGIAVLETWTDGPSETRLTWALYKMPITADDIADFPMVSEILRVKPGHVFLERATSFGMGVTGAFNYGRSFETITLAVKNSKCPLTMVGPSEWTKVMHQGVDSRLATKIKTWEAILRLFPTIAQAVPRNAKQVPHDGIVDAVMIAAYGQRVLAGGGKIEKQKG